jgi:adenylyl-sulfate kinase
VTSFHLTHLGLPEAESIHILHELFAEFLDPVSDRTVAAGTITGRLATEPAKRNTQGTTVWLTGLSGAGKSTVANLLADRVRESGAKVKVLDGDALRTTICKDLGFSREDREENIRRIGLLCELLNHHGVITIVATISPYRAARNEVRTKIQRFIEVFVNCPLHVLIQRDPKGMYKRALVGEIRHFTGISDPYETPEHPELTIYSSEESAEESADHVFSKMRQLGVFDE